MAPADQLASEQVPRVQQHLLRRLQRVMLVIRGRANLLLMDQRLLLTEPLHGGDGREEQAMPWRETTFAACRRRKGYTTCAARRCPRGYTT